MRIEISLQYILVIFTAIVWLSVLYMKIVVRKLKKQINEAHDLAYIGKSRCEAARRNHDIMGKFYKIVVIGLLILMVIFVGDEVVRLFAFFRNASMINDTKLINVNLLLGLLAYSGFWYMVRDVRGYSVLLLNRCKELAQ